jgi:dimethylamine monooxygenase subunit A
VLTGAVLVFPVGLDAGAEDRAPALRIHVPVVPYDADIGRRVQRLFDGLRPGGR